MSEDNNIKDIKENSEQEIKISFGRKKIIALILIAVVSVATVFIILTYLEVKESEKRIILATTTSTYDSGLLDYILPKFEEKYDIRVEVLSVGTGQAIETGKRGDCDVLLVHARDLEDEFVDEGYGVHRACVMYNDFILVGPSTDPAGVSGKNITEAFKAIKNAGESGNAEFYSRGDNSGTNVKELYIWNLVNITPDSSSDPWYKETGSGMGDTLTITDQSDKGYTLVDRGTWLSYKDSISLTLLVEGDKVLLNPYGAILVNPDKFSHVNFTEARQFVAFLVSEEGQQLIGDFRKNGEVLFHPCFGHCDEDFDCPTTQEELDYWKKYNGSYEGNSIDNIIFIPNDLITSSDW
ncbi:MAG: substrate-binding domain-containing protein [Promethearchaeota archaeon]